MNCSPCVLHTLTISNIYKKNMTTFLLNYKKKALHSFLTFANGTAILIMLQMLKTNERPSL
jgi:hypothetical protein